ncbi:SDR family oxidoreductase [Microbacterium sp. MPKO10]|uniref:SDR family oxidoreductase n=1 Tax=Microbacterium sp. MPKO10 TaxID=2989818 RepID=UPI002235A717|nr:SDR family oxidoreductase [Microbacterium sp. MPKO10]MCW4458639.1 SDR family oxidoreductase [Microbacterium sp. MPKO10]
MTTSFRGATVLITGAGSGIGRLMALGAAERGAHVVIWDLAAGAAEAVCTEIVAKGGEAQWAAVDVSNTDAVAAAASSTPPVDVLVNNAGIVTGQHLLDATDDAIKRTFDVNTLALFWVTRAFLPGMIERQRGTVVTVSSAASLVGVAKQTDYAASKFAARGFAESLKAELRTLGSPVRSMVACPYYIDTGMFAGVQTRFPRILPIMTPEYVVRRILDGIEGGRTELLMPRFTKLVNPARILPVPAFDALMNFFGVNSTMDHFVGRKSPSPVAEAADQD